MSSLSWCDPHWLADLGLQTLTLSGFGRGRNWIRRLISDDHAALAHIIRGLTADARGPFSGGSLCPLIGEGEAPAGLDSLRAARQMPELKLDERAVVWGHWQGGHSALWTGIIGPRYTRDIRGPRIGDRRKARKSGSHWTCMGLFLSSGCFGLC